MKNLCVLKEKTATLKFLLATENMIYIHDEQGDPEIQAECAKNAYEYAADVLNYRDYIGEDVYFGAVYIIGYLLMTEKISLEGLSAKDGFTMILTAAKHEQCNAIHALGVCYLNGNFVSESFQKAEALFREAADRGNTDSMYALYLMYCDNPQTKRSAKKYLSDAAKAGNFKAKFVLGNDYVTGTGVIGKNLEKGLELLRECAEYGNTQAADIVEDYTRIQNVVSKTPAETSADVAANIVGDVVTETTEENPDANEDAEVVFCADETVTETETVAGSKSEENFDLAPADSGENASENL